MLETLPGWRRRAAYPGRGWPRRLAGVALALGLVSVFVAAARHLGRLSARPVVVERVAIDGFPALPALAERYDGVVLADYLGGDLHAPDDPLLRSPVLEDVDFTRAVHGWVDYWTGPASGWFPGFLERMALTAPFVDSMLAAEGLPPSLRYLPLIESGYDPRVTSTASAVGLWQLMSTTARDMGLTVTPAFDERRSPERSTEAALRYIGYLQNDFDSWWVTLAAYNGGWGRVRAVLRRHAPGEPATDSLLWALRAHLPAETRAFLPKLYGAMWVASRPGAYGFARPDTVPEAVDRVRVEHRTTLDVVALAAGVAYREVVRLNPEFLRGVTPEHDTVLVRLPAGSARTFHRIYPRIRPQDRVSFVRHEISPGETLSGIAARYGVSVDELLAENPALAPRTLNVGQRVTIPVPPPPDAATPHEVPPV